MLLLCSTPLAMAAKIPVLLCTDVGNEIDDQWAITYLLTQPDFDVLGIASAHAPTQAMLPLIQKTACAAYETTERQVPLGMGSSNTDSPVSATVTVGRRALGLSMSLRSGLIYASSASGSA